MRKPKLLSRLSALATALVCAFGFMAQSTSVIAEAAESWTETQKNQQHELEYWGYDFEGSGLPKAYNPIKGTIKYENSSKTIAQGMTNPSFNERWATDFYYWIRLTKTAERTVENTTLKAVCKLQELWQHLLNEKMKI